MILLFWGGVRKQEIDWRYIYRYRYRYRYRYIDWRYIYIYIYPLPAAFQLLSVCAQGNGFIGS